MTGVPIETLDISVVIPTHDRADSLVRAVTSALILDYPADRYEVVVVDNASRDATPSVARELQNTAGGGRVRYVRESRLGLHRARHAGARCARGRLLAFTDDDATFDRGWIRAYVEAFDAHPEMAAAGGPVRPAWETPPPQWLLDYMAVQDPIVGGAAMFAILSLMEPFTEFRLDRHNFFVGTNMAVRRADLFELRGFNPDSFGPRWLGDGEDGLAHKLRRRGSMIGYVPAALVHHHIGVERMTPAYFRKRMANQGACDIYTRFHDGLPDPLRLARCAVTEAATVVRRTHALARTGRGTTPGALRAQMELARDWRHLTYTLRLIWDKHLRAMVERTDWLE